MPHNGQQKGSKGSRRFSPFRRHQSEVPQYVMGHGPIPAKIMLIGERPGEEEAYNVPPLPFIGLAGRYLNILLDNAGIDRGDIYITNLVKTFSGYGKPTLAEIQRDADILAAELTAVRPVVVGLLGTFAVEAILGRERAGLERTHGIPVQYTSNNGMANGYGGTVSGGVYLPMFHPGTIIYDINAMPQCQVDFNKLRALVDEYEETNKIEIVSDRWAGKERYFVVPEGDTYEARLDCAIDTEGSVRRPWCATFSTAYGSAWLTYPGTKVDISSEVVYLHNSLHDLGVLRTLGITLGDDQFRDTMVWAYLLCLEPQGLKELAYRHFGMEMMSYQDVIGEASENRALEYLMGVMASEWPKAEPFVEIKAGKAKVRKPQGINQRVSRILGDYEKRKGTDDPVDVRERWNKVADYVKAPVVEMLGEMPDATLDDVPKARAEWYANRDADATRRLGPVLADKIRAMGLEQISGIDHGIIPMADRMQTVGWKLAPPTFWKALGDECDRRMYTAVHKIRELTGWIINPDSGDQTAELLYDYLGITPPKMTEGGEKKESRGSTDDKSLEAIAHLHPVVDLIFDYREPSKVKSSFVAPLSKQCQIDDGRYRYGLRITRVSSGRLAGVGKPNLLAIPVRTELGKQVREGFVAEDGKEIYDIDLNQIEMREMADQSRDPGMCKIFVEGKLDVHTDNAAMMFGKRYTDIDPDGAERYAAKRVGFGIITQITEVGLVAQMTLARAKRPDGQPWTQDDCANLIKGFYEARPAVRRMLDDSAEEARRTGMARTRNGRIRYLPGIWSPQKAVAAEAARQAGSFKISGSAQEIIKIAMKHMWNSMCKVPWLRTEPLIQVHDEMVLEVPSDPVVKSVVNDQAVWCMTKTSTYPSGIPIKAKGKYGPNWAKAK